MIKTKHIQQRQSQRNISDDMIKVALQYGEKKDSAYILSRNTAAQLLIKYSKKLIVFSQSNQSSQLMNLVDNLKKITSLNGLVVIKRDGVIITTFSHAHHT